MNILIVDDNRNNRMILSLLLEDYMEENSGISFGVDEAVDGLEAVRMCDEKEYSLVFMDIMMPNMDGIEATRLIRQKHTKLMIIAVSAVDDMEKQKQILANGAEDYITKPVNSDIFNARVGNYIHIINSREMQGKASSLNEKGINLFTQEIYNRHIKFILSSEDALSELWEYYLLDFQEQYEGMSDIIRMIFSLGEVQLKLNLESALYVEDSQKHKYFTVTKIDAVPPKIIELLLKKNEVSCEVKNSGERLSFRLERVEESREETPNVELDTPLEVQEELASSIEYTSSALEVYDYIESYDMSDLEEYSGRLNSLMLIVGSGDISEDEVTEIANYIDKIASILSTYSEVYTISQALSTLAFDMSTHNDEFVQNSEALAPMCKAFSKDLANWLEQSFHTGAPSIDFMNDTIAVNCQTIGSMLKMNDESSDDDFDDIFDF